MTDLVPQTRKPWERQHGESSKAFAAFAYYRDLPPQTRSQQKVAEYLAETTQRRGTVDSIRSELSKWASKWRWTERVEAFELEQDRVAIDAREQARREMEERHLSGASALTFAALARLRGLDRTEKQGGPVSALHPMQITDFTEATRVFETAVRIERLTRGMPTDLTKALNTVPVEKLRGLVYDLVAAVQPYVAEEAWDDCLAAIEDACRRFG